MKKLTLVATLAALFTIPALAQSTEGQSLVIYGLGAAMSGTVGVGPISGEIDASASDILSNLEMGGMAAYRYETGRWAWGGEAIYMGLGAAQSGLDVGVDEWIIAATAGYSINDHFSAIGGLRYMDLATELSVTGPAGTERSGNVGASWVDPFLGARVDLPAGTRSKVVLQGSVGGFGIGSDLSIDAGGFFETGLSKSTSILLGYRLLDVDYEDGSGADYFKFDTISQGPVVGVRFQF